MGILLLVPLVHDVVGHLVDAAMGILLLVPLVLLGLRDDGDGAPPFLEAALALGEIRTGGHLPLGLFLDLLLGVIDIFRDLLASHLFGQHDRRWRFVFVHHAVVHG